MRTVLACLLVLAATGCATVPRETAQLRSTPVACQLGNAAPAGAPRGSTLSAFDCAGAGGSYEAADPLVDFNLWLALAKDGNPVAQTRVGGYYERGLAGVAPDHATAAIWYRRAVKQDHAPAMLRLAVLADQGLGMRSNADQARDLLRRASRGAFVAIPPPSLYLVEPSVLLSGAADGDVVSATVDRPEGPLAVMGRVTSPADRPRSVQFNDQTLKLDGEGYFHASVMLRSEGTTLKLQTTDPGGRSTRAEVRLLPGKAVPPPLRTAALNRSAAGELHALLIANQDYRSFEKLDTPANDARDLKQVLERRFGYKTTLLLNATRREVLAALATLRAQLSAKDELLVFYAGHGEVDAVTQRAYWIPVDGRRNDSSDWISSVEVSDQLQAVAARRVLLVVDSCYAGSLNRRALRGGDVDLAAASLQVEPPESASDSRTRVALSSGGFEPVSDGAGGRNSLYAGTLLEVLRAASAPLTAEQLHGEVAARFLWRARQMKLSQRPSYGPVRLAGHEAGDFTLVPRRP